MPGDDKIGLLRQQSFEIDTLVAAKAPQFLRGGWVIAVIDDADNALASANGEQNFGDVRCQADDALCRPG